MKCWHHSLWRGEEAGRRWTDPAHQRGFLCWEKSWPSWNSGLRAREKKEGKAQDNGQNINTIRIHNLQYLWTFTTVLHCLSTNIHFWHWDQYVWLLWRFLFGITCSGKCNYVFILHVFGRNLETTQRQGRHANSTQWGHNWPMGLNLELCCTTALACCIFKLTVFVTCFYIDRFCFVF